MSVRPILLLSPPRSGSTYVQRVLAAHRGVATASEPWILLPVLYGLRREGIRAEYWHEAAAEAIEDFCATLPGGRAAYVRAAGEMASRLYQEAAGPEARFFVDKTPHYALIADDVIDALPDAKLLFLWRSPLAILASLLRFRAGRWEPSLFRADLYDGLANLVAAYARAGERASAVRYEDLVAGEEAWRSLAADLGVEWEPEALARFGEVELTGRYGDPAARTGEEPDPGASARWRRETLAGPVRAAWCRRWLRWLGSERLATMGYDLDALLAEVDELPRGNPARIPVDAVQSLAARRTAEGWRRRLRAPDSPRPRPTGRNRGG